MKMYLAPFESIARQPLSILRFPKAKKGNPRFEYF